GTNDVYVLLGDNIEVTMLYDDYESDEAYSMVYDFEHTNPNYFENSLGKDPNAGTGLLKPLTTLNYVGHYEVRPKAKDNPKDDDRFAEYRLENMDEALVNVYVHRRPIALMNFRFGVSSVEPNYLTLTCTDNGSYDLDHESAIGKGIVKYEFAIKGENDASWIKVNQSSFTHLKIERGVEYKIIYRVQDIEGAWSLPLEKTFKLDEVPVNLTAKIQARDDGFSIDGMPITEYFNIYDIETEYPKELKLEIALYDGDIRKGSLITVPFNEGASAVRDGTNPNLVKWNPRDLQVPLTLPDKAYQLKVTAIDVSNPLKTAEVVFDVGVRTPINLYPEIMPEELLAEEAYMLKAFTSKYAGTLIVKAFKDTAKEKSITMPLDGSVVANMKKWLKEEVVPAVDEGEYTFEFTATTPNGNSETAIL
ncbi:MAG: hypothetical protein JXO44_13020, partial [Clostridia bacterium]|nr:hypothetical protein [Clostridia bacterium]